MGSSIDLRDHMENDAVHNAFSKLVSGGKMGYKTVIEKKKVPPKCEKCGRGGDDGQKFCPQCGGKMSVPLTNCPGCRKPINEGQQFCTECGYKLK
ncbi:zinc ribbon domain-containing protein [Candidatus Pacearchaeota archaeon]|nr:zinc ribbon domain-containing protein [Candidatus Pacearchaeota archaeon]